MTVVAELECLTGERWGSDLAIKMHELSLNLRSVKSTTLKRTYPSRAAAVQRGGNAAQSGGAAE